MKLPSDRASPVRASFYSCRIKFNSVLKEHRVSPDTLCSQRSAPASPPISWGLCRFLDLCPKCLFSSCMPWKLLCSLQNHDPETSSMNPFQLSLPLRNASHTSKCYIITSHLLPLLHETQWAAFTYALFCVPNWAANPLREGVPSCASLPPSFRQMTGTEDSNQRSLLNRMLHGWLYVIETSGSSQCKPSNIS